MRTVIYARFSSAKQNEISIEAQLRICHKHAVESGDEIVGEYIDRAKSARTDNRPSYQRMMKDAKTGIFEKILVYKLDRFARNVKDHYDYKYDLEKTGVRICSVTEDIPDTPEGELFEGLIILQNAYYSKVLGKRVAEGMRQNAMHCRVNGSPLLGYKTGADKRYEIEEKGAALVRLIFDLYIDLRNFTAVAAEINSRGHRTLKGKLFTKRHIHDIVTARRYIGEYKFSDIVVPGGMPRIVSDEIFNKVQSLMNDTQHVPHAKYVLTGKLYCGDCKKKMFAGSGRSHTGAKHDYYRCGACKRPYVPREALENLVYDLTREHVLTGNVIDRIATVMFKEYQASLKNDPVTEKKADLRRLDRQLENLINSVAEGIAPALVAPKIQDLNEQRTALAAEIERIEKNTAAFTTKDDFAAMLRHYATTENADDATRALLIKTFVSKVFLYADKITIVFNFKAPGGGQEEITTILPEKKIALGDEGKKVLKCVHQGCHFVLFRTLTLKKGVLTLDVYPK